MEELREKLETAAIYGQKLLEENQILRIDLKKERDKNAEMLQYISEINVGVKNDDDNMIKMEDKIKTLIYRNDLLVSQLNEAEKTNKNLLEELNGHDNKNIDQNKFSLKLKTEIKDLKEKLGRKNKELEDLSDKNNQYSITNMKLSKTVEYEKNQNKLLSSRIEELEKDIKKVNKIKRIFEQKEIKMENEMYKLIEENEKLSMKANQIHEKVLIKILDQKHENIICNDTHKQTCDNSLFDQLNHGSIEKKNIDDKEFFNMTTTSIKIGLSLKYPHKSEEILKINADILYNEAITKKIPFHDWYTWIINILKIKLENIETPSLKLKGKPTIAKDKLWIFKK